MSEVEKMYENAGIKAKWKDKRVKNTKTYYTEEQAKYLRQTTKNRNIQLLYPPFTAEKQIAILQLLTQRCDLTISHFTEWEFIHYDGQEPLEITGTDFVETFAKLINAYWQDLTEQDRTEIAEILK